MAAGRPAAKWAAPLRCQESPRPLAPVAVPPDGSEQTLVSEGEVPERIVGSKEEASKATLATEENVRNWVVSLGLIARPNKMPLAFVFWGMGAEEMGSESPAIRAARVDPLPRCHHTSSEQ